MWGLGRISETSVGIPFFVRKVSINGKSEPRQWHGRDIIMKKERSLSTDGQNAAYV